MCNNRERRQRRPRASAETIAKSDSNIPAKVWDPVCPEWLRHECRLVWPAADCSSSCQNDHTGYSRPPPAHRHQPQPPQPITTPAEHSAPRPLPSRGHRWGWWPGIVMYTLLMFSLLSPGLSLSPSSGVNSVQETGVCTSMDIRNSPANLKALTGCRVIEGFLQIVLMDNSDEKAFENMTFPELREITGYLMVFRAYGLQSLGKLFPNLAVIRGQDLFSNYALVVYECRSMKELGLHSLTDIIRGGVRLEKNNNMCYVKTLDWNLIAPNAPVGHYFKENKPENECPVCPGDDGVHEGGLVCPEAPDQSPFSPNKKHLCWNKEHCQKVCKKECGNMTCSPDGRCCDESCLGGCTGSLTNCTVCRDFSIGDYKDRKCIRDCPNNTLRHYKRRCITEAQCRSFPKPKGINTMDQMSKFPFRPFNGTCTKECPHGYYEKNDNGLLSCIPCQGPCRKVCTGNAKLDSIESIQKMKGCTHIIGSLSIESIKGGGSIVKELEDGVGLIEEITGSLKIVRCFPLVSLNFFKRLKVIGGEISDVSANATGVYSSFIVNDNQNLQELWDWDTHGPIEIRKGELFFHLNPKLCLEKIDPLKTMAKETKFSPMEVVRNSNGDKVACNVTLLDLKVATRTSVSVMFSWPSFQLGDERALLGYVMHSIEAPHQNITFFDGRDACRNDGWKLDDVQPTRANEVVTLLTHLKAYTQYAVYVKTETISTERQGAQSKIIYVRTLPGRPSQPKIEKLVPLSSDTLMLSWSPPDHPNGNITMYKILVQWEEDDEEYFRQRNYCFEPLEPPEDKKIDIEDDLPPRQTPETTPLDGKCPCQPPSITKDDDEAIGDISFENQLHNQVYFKKQDIPLDDETRRRRDVEAAKRRWTRSSSGFPLGIAEEKPPLQEAKTLMDPSGVYDVYAVEVGPEQRSINITHLRHFASHMVSIWACREVEKDELGNNGINDTEPNCSIDIVKSERTLKLDGADEISKLRVRVLQANQSLGMAKLEWMEPEKPNGPIVTYTIMYNRLDIENHSPVKECITRAQFINGSNSYIIKNLNAGNYSIKVMVTSLAGDGNYSAEKNFYIESAGNNNMSVILAVVGGILVAILVMGVAYFIHRRYFAPPPFAPTKIIASVNPEYVSSEYVPDEWEVPREKVQLIKELGQGAFGMVYEGIAKDIKDNAAEMRCAVKTINEHATDRERIEFLNEASVMKAFDTAHVVRLLGVVSRGQPTFVVMELMANGDLKSYLRSHRPDAEKPRNAQPPPLSRLLQMAMEIADGMSYLSAKKFVHRDLAARNCMVAEDLTVKVGDFGMTRDIYETDYYRKGSKGLLPVRWMSPESLKDGVFTSSSDVWSYGVVLWEMATLASQPYQGLSNDQVLRYVIDGGVMERPENCPDRLYQLMQLTWHHRATERPTFLQLVNLLVGDASPTFREISFFYSTQGQEMLHQSQHQQTGVSEEPAQSTSGGGLASWSRGLNSMDSDSSPPPSPRPSPASASYRDVMRLVPFGERVRAAPHETEALVNLSHSAPPPKVSPPQSSSQSNAPNGYLPRSGNNGNPSSLNTSRC